MALSRVSVGDGNQMTRLTLDNVLCASLRSRVPVALGYTPA